MLNTDEFKSRLHNGSLQHFFLGDRVLASTHRGQYIYLLPSDLDLTPSILLRGQFEMHVERALTGLIRPGDKVIDVGANVGYHTLAIADAVGSFGQVYAFEANPDIMRLLKATMIVNSFSNFRGTGRVNLYENAVLDKPGTITLAVAPGHYGSGHVINSAPASDYGAAYSARVEVPGVRLDAVLGPNVGAIDLLHMDIEGSEPLAVRGAQALIDRSPKLKIVMEWSTGMMSTRADVGEFVAWLTGRGFRFRLIEHSGQLTEIAASALLSLPHSDIVLSRD